MEISISTPSALVRGFIGLGSWVELSVCVRESFVRRKVPGTGNPEVQYRAIEKKHSFRIDSTHTGTQSYGVRLSSYLDGDSHKKYKFIELKGVISLTLQ